MHETSRICFVLSRLYTYSLNEFWQDVRFPTKQFFNKNKVMKPVCICEYNEYMAEVDHLDQMTSYTAHISTAVNDQIFHFYDRSLKICRITNIAEIIIS